MLFFTIVDFAEMKTDYVRIIHVGANNQPEYFLMTLGANYGYNLLMIAAI